MRTLPRDFICCEAQRATRLMIHFKTSPSQVRAVQKKARVMKFCSECAAPIEIKIPADDNHARHVCTQCGTIHYQNPKMVVGTLPVWDQDNELQILLCRRAIEPRRGFWTLPAGFMENQETSSEAAIRETQEEAGATIELYDLFSILNVPHVDQVHLFYRARLLNAQFEAGTESLEVKLFRESEIPWDEIAFATVSHTLRFFFEDLRRPLDSTRCETQQRFRLHAHDLFHPDFQRK